ncbi:hypothetical protein RvY_01963 [Ramazzottius varieornatus]|uniref:Uncharacterized protein n=1 Tax=Ramazzottius varieornatus TaxID=947166 RepID=A0A1D1UP43_RAMVA|nr:hypothetical protein RvY_01963 [Ramazzottius varieornatus]
MLEFPKEAMNFSSFGLDDGVEKGAKAACREYDKEDKEEAEICEREFMTAMPSTMHKVSTYIGPEVMCQRLDYSNVRDESWFTLCIDLNNSALAS